MPNRVFSSPEQQQQFDAICDLARNNDAITLSEIIRTSGDISEDHWFANLHFIDSTFHKSYCYTPIMALAMEGEYEAVELLLTQYSNIDERCYSYKKMQALKGYVLGGQVEHINQLVKEKEVTPEQVFYAYHQTSNETRFLDSHRFNFRTSGLKRLVAFTDNETLRKLLIDKFHDDPSDRHYSLKNRLLNESKLANQFVRSCHMDWSCGAWVTQYNILFLEVIPHLMMKNIPEAAVGLCLSFLMPFSENEIFNFLKKQSEIPPGQSSWRMGCHTLFLRQATFNFQNQPKDLFITKAELKDCLSYFTIRRLPDIKRLLQQENDNISYKAICAALPKDGTTSRVIDAINKKFDEKLTAKVGELNH